MPYAPVIPSTMKAGRILIQPMGFPAWLVSLKIKSAAAGAAVAIVRTMRQMRSQCRSISFMLRVLPGLSSSPLQNS